MLIKPTTENLYFLRKKEILNTLWRDTTTLQNQHFFDFPTCFIHVPVAFAALPGARLCCQTRINKADPVDTFKVRRS
ncbi:hypothetical protein OJAV_G00077460 [Oryzias javanicus]|uniref:Uncharacterized protein n=1 Tax=Oryzias javanicus TaxID=123683 RepID=A0A3S2PBI5_ORYJA|nr:hypothetical protein OJAV_G00077460 [Oryzias javanicus]